jgi:protein-glutamine gamma-glutamyltransferase
MFPRTVDLHERTFRAEIDRLLDVSLFALVVVAFVAVAGTGKLDLFSLAAVVLAILVRAYLFFRRADRQLSVATTTKLTIAYFFIYAADYLFLSGSFITATVHLVLFVLVVKLFSVHRDRDRMYLAVISFLMLLSAAILTIDTFFLGAFICFSLIAIVAFITMEMRRSMNASASVAPVRSGARLGRMVSMTATALIACILLLTPPLFFALPRVSAGRLQQFAQQNEFTSGFGDDVTLGQIGIIQQSDTVVMRAQFEQPPPVTLKWHGTTLTHFDGRRWFNRLPERASVEMHGGLDNGVGFGSVMARRILDGANELVARSADAPAVRQPIFQRYKVNLEPTGTNIFFYPSRLVWIRGSMRDYSLAMSATVSYRQSSAIAIRAYSGMSVVFPHEDQITRETPAPGPAYLELPPMDSRVAALATQVTANATNPYEKALAIEEHLRTKYGYTLEMVATDNPIPYFLFERKKGHCEYFASAMAVMLRTQGIPSRIVNGFRGGELSDITGSYIVRGRDAHSWVEAFIPGRGWVEFDPTPAGDPVAHTMWSRIGLYLDAAKEFWGEWVVNYDFSHQSILAEFTTTKTRLSLESVWKRLQGRYFSGIVWLQKALSDVRDPQQLETPQGWVKPLGALTVLLGTIWALSTWMRMRRIAKLPPESMASLWLERLLRKLGKRGLKKSASQTATHWAQSAPDSELRRALAQFVREYESARFGASPESAARLPELYEEIEGALKK